MKVVFRILFSIGLIVTVNQLYASCGEENKITIDSTGLIHLTSSSYILKDKDKDKGEATTYKFTCDYPDRNYVNVVKITKINPDVSFTFDVGFTRCINFLNSKRTGLIDSINGTLPTSTGKTIFVRNNQKNIPDFSAGISINPYKNFIEFYQPTPYSGFYKDVTTKKLKVENGDLLGIIKDSLSSRNLLQTADELYADIYKEIMSTPNIEDKSTNNLNKIELCCYLNSNSKIDAITKFVNNNKAFIIDSISGFIAANAQLLITSYRHTGNFSLNPFNIRDSLEIKRDKDFLQKKLTNQIFIDSLKMKCNPLYTVANKICDTIQKLKLTNDQVLALYANPVIDDLTRRLDSTSKDATLLLKERVDNINKFLNKEIVVNDLYLYRSKAKLSTPITYMRFHDYSDKISVQADNYGKKLDSYSKEDNVKIISYNIPSNIDYKFASSFHDSSFNSNIFTDEFSSRTKTFLDFLDSDNIKNLKNVFTLNTDVANRSDCCSMNGNAGENKITTLNTFLLYYAMLKWVSKQTLPQKNLPEPVNVVHIFHSETEDAEYEKTGVYKYTITTKKDTATKYVNNSKFNVYQKKYVDLTTMVAFNTENKNNPRKVTSYDETTQTFTTTPYKPVDAVAGIKVYPFGINPKRWFPTYKGRYRSLFRQGNLPINRISIFAGLSLNQNQFRNYFTGLGFEIVPGLGINGGFNFYGVKKYKLENGKKTDEKYKFYITQYFGITVDPIVLLQVTNIIKK